MTTYNTGNPIGSVDVKDLYDNAQNLDIAVNTRTAESWNDRFGVARKTWWGLEQDFQQFLLDSGYVNIGDYAPGLEITARNQTFVRDGELYRAGASLSLPYTTTGDWLTEGSMFVAVGDSSLRQDLSLAEGSALVGYGSTTVEGAIDESLLTSLYSDLPASAAKTGLTAFVQGYPFLFNGTEWIPLGDVNPVIFGADNTGTTDTSEAFSIAAAFCVAHEARLVSRPDDVFLLESQADIRYIKGVDLQGPIVTDTDDFIPVVMGFSSLNRHEVDLKIRSVTWRNQPGSGIDLVNLPANPLIRIVGCKNTNIHIGTVDYIQLYADSDDATTESLAYCNFYINQVEKLEFATNPSPTGTLIQWINENKFWGGRLRRIILSGTYNHNHNIFYNPTIERNGLVGFSVGSSNRIIGARLESTDININLASGTYNNIITQSWTPTLRDGVTAFGSNITLVDEGVSNIVIRDQHAWMDRIPMFSLGFMQSLDSVTSQYGVSAPSLTRAGNYWRIGPSDTLFESQLIPCVAGMGFDMRSTESVWRCYIKFFSNFGTQVTGADPGLLSSGSFTWSEANNRYERNSDFANIPTIPVVITGNGYVQLEIASGASSTDVNIRRFSLTAIIPKGVDHASMAACMPKFL